MHGCSFPGCLKTFPKRSKLERHELTHSGNREFECRLCERRFKRKDHLNRHRTSHTPNATRPFACNIDGCESLGFFDKSHLDRHIKQVHLQMNKCLICFSKDITLIFTKKFQLLRHMTESHGEPPPFKCEVCAENIYSSCKYQKHLGRHRTHVDYLRQIPQIPVFGGGVEVIGKRSLQEETKTTHTLDKVKEREYICPFVGCYKIFNRKYNLGTHIKTSHLKERSFTCKYLECEAAYLHHKSLKEHYIRVHSLIHSQYLVQIYLFNYYLTEFQINTSTKYKMFK